MYEKGHRGAREHALTALAMYAIALVASLLISGCAEGFVEPQAEALHIFAPESVRASYVTEDGLRGCVLPVRITGKIERAEVRYYFRYADQWVYGFGQGYTSSASAAKLLAEGNIKGASNNLPFRQRLILNGGEASHEWECAP